LSVTGTPRSMTIAAKPASLGAVRTFVREGAMDAGLPEERIGELDLVIDELIMNVWTHGYSMDMPGDVTVTYTVPAPGELRVEVADQGVAFNPLEAEPPDLASSLEARPIGGLGIYLVKSLATSLTYRREQGWNRLTIGISAGS